MLSIKKLNDMCLHDLKKMDIINFTEMEKMIIQNRIDYEERQIKDFSDKLFKSDIFKATILYMERNKIERSGKLIIKNLCYLMEKMSERGPIAGEQEREAF